MQSKFDNKENINIHPIKSENDDSPVLKDHNNKQIKSAYTQGNKQQINFSKIGAGSTKGNNLSKGNFKQQKKESVFSQQFQFPNDQYLDSNQSINQLSNQDQSPSISFSSSVRNLQPLSSRNNYENMEQDKLQSNLKFYNASTISYQKVQSSKQRYTGLESSSLGSNEMRSILRSSFQKQQDLHSTSFKYSCQGLKNQNLSQIQTNVSTAAKNSLNFTTEVGDSTNKSNRGGAFEQEQSCSMTFQSRLLMQSEILPSNNFISTQPSPDREIEEKQEEEQQMDNLPESQDKNKPKSLTIQTNKYNQKKQNLRKKIEELDADLARTGMLNVEEHLEESQDNRNYPSSPLFPISVSRIYKESDSRKITQMSSDFSMLTQQTNLFCETQNNINIIFNSILNKV